jgi:imidazolonepropionase-like amidohydrolase
VNDLEARAVTYATDGCQLKHRRSQLYRRSVGWITIGALCLALGTTPARGERDVTLVGPTIYPAPGASVISNGVVIVRDGGIAAIGTRDAVSVPTNARVLDCSGLFVTAGLWNNHVHLTPWRLAMAGWLPGFVSAGEIRAMVTRYGFVHVLDTGSLPGNALRLRTRIAQGGLVGPDIRIAAGSFVAPGGSPFYLWPLRLPELKTLAEAREKVLRTLDAGANGIKLFTGGLAAPDAVVVMDADIVRAATTAAHERGAFVVAHPSNSAGARAAIEGESTSWRTPSRPIATDHGTARSCHA